MRYEFDSDKGKYSDVQFHMPNGRLHGFGPWKGSATITATDEEKGGQLVQVFVIGDTPWSALSEYRVVNNKIYPLRHADSAAWLLIGVVVCPGLRDGKVIAESIKDAFLFYLGFCALISVAVCAMMGVVWFMRSMGGTQGFVAQQRKEVVFGEIFICGIPLF